MKNDQNIIIKSLLEKANKLPLSPGVYIMKDKNGKVIYVGKSKKLKARVSQYFQNSEKNVKTQKMVSSVFEFEYILCDTEIEALTLENTLIKQYSPRYNIRLKDAKSYPYIKITSEDYPRLIVTRQRIKDNAQYFGPYSGASVAFSIVAMLEKALGLPNCKRRFPKDIGKERPCIYLQIGRCCGVCNNSVSREDYLKLIKAATEVLQGKISTAKRYIEKEMYAYSESEQFEAAARCRDTINSLAALTQKQHVVSSPDSELDVIGLYNDDAVGSAISVMCVRNGAVMDCSTFTFGSDEIIEDSDIISFLSEHYKSCEYIPKNICLSFDLSKDNAELFVEYLLLLKGKKTIVCTPQRGNLRALCELAVENAKEKLSQFCARAQKDDNTLYDLAKLLCLETVPERIEAYDISNFGNEMITAGMIVCQNARFVKKDYRLFIIKTIAIADDYASMKEAILRRFSHINDKNSSFSQIPDLILLDGGKGHVAAVKSVLDSLNIDIPVFGMIKDDHHKTRALTNESDEINIARIQNVFGLIYRIQEEVHRFAISQMKAAKNKTVKSSSLENINGIGKAKAKLLLSSFKSLKNIAEADRDVISSIKGISEKNADNIYLHFHGGDKNK